MGRFLLLLLIGVFAVVVNPNLRAKAEPYVQPVLDPVYEWQTTGRVNEIAKAILTQTDMDRPPPTSRTFGEFLQHRYASEAAARDSWGTPYYLRRSHRSITVGSAGPDRKVGTADDIRSDPVSFDGR